MIKILVVDDHPVVRAGVVGMLAGEADIAVIGEATSGAEALVRMRKSPADVVLMDLRMPELDGAETTARILANSPKTRVLVLTTYETDADILRAVEAGAAGYLLKDVSRADLLDAIRSAAAGRTVLAPSVATRLLQHMREPATDRLSPREVEVLRLVAQGLSNSEIGRELYISETTVKTHLLRAFGKLGVSDRTAAVTKAQASGQL